MYVILLQFPLGIFSPILLSEGDVLESEGEERAKISAGHEWAVEALELEQLLPRGTLVPQGPRCPGRGPSWWAAEAGALQVIAEYFGASQCVLLICWPLSGPFLCSVCARSPRVCCRLLSGAVHGQPGAR